MIYIDPPYNTGGDFVYKDDYSAPLQSYLLQTGQIDEEGNKLLTNRESSGRYHSDWLSMIYPRLKLAWNLLKEDGVVCVSIDDNEMHHLRMVMNEVFGEEQFIGTITWEKRTKAQNTETAKQQFQSKTEYILLYKKQNSKMAFNLELSGEKTYDKEDNNGKYRLKLVEEMSSYGMRGRQTMIFPIKGVEPREGFQWKVGKETVKSYKDRGDIEVIDGKPYFRVRPDDESSEKHTPFWSHFFDKDTYGTAETGKSELTKILGTPEHNFETVKPVKLLKKLIFHITEPSENDIILDFFGGSGTTAQAVYEQNSEDSGNRKFVLVQLPEPLEKEVADRTKLKTVSDIAKARMRKVIEELKNNDGFKLFELSKSNFHENDFDFDPSKSPKENEETFKEYLEVLGQRALFDDINELDVVYENIIKEGLSLNSKIQDETIGSNKVYKVEDNEQGLLICLDKEVEEDSIKVLTSKEYADKTFICLDAALDDSGKANLALNLELKTI